MSNIEDSILLEDSEDQTSLTETLTYLIQYDQQIINNLPENHRNNLEREMKQKYSLTFEIPRGRRNFCPSNQIQIIKKTSMKPIGFLIRYLPFKNLDRKKY